MTKDKITRRTALKASSTALLTGTALAGCLSNPTSSGGSNSGSGGGGNGSGGNGSGSGGGSGSGSSGLNIAIISSPAGFGDQAFNDLALQGLQRASNNFGVNIQQVEETNQSQYQTTQSRLAESQNPAYDLIVLVSYNHLQALETNAPQYPDQRWMLINDTIGESNVAGYIWANHQMSFQAGVLAGTMTTRQLSHQGNSTTPQESTVGFVGGVDESLIRAFQRAYTAGVQWVDDSIETRIGYAGSYSDPQAAREVALSQYDSGADIVYHAAAASGEGVFQAAEQQSQFAIGVDADQSVTLGEYQDVIMGSAVKYINEGTFEVARALDQSNWQSVQGENVLGLEEEGVEIVLGQAIGPKLPGVVNDNLSMSREAILNGDITVPCSATGCGN